MLNTYQPPPQMVITNANPRNCPLRQLQIGNTQTNVLFILWTILFANISITTSETRVPSFLNLPLTYLPWSSHKIDELIASIVSHIACAGESFSSNSTISYRYRTCQFHNLCYNTDTNEYVVFPSPEELALQELLHTLPSKEFVTISSIAYDSHTISLSTNSSKKLSLGTIRSDAQARESAVWFPNVLTDISRKKRLLRDGYYQLPDDTVVFPIVLPSPAVNGARAEALIWLDFFAVFTVLSMFGLEQKKQPIFIVHNENEEIDELILSSPLWSIFGNETSKHIGRFNHPTQMKARHPENNESTTNANSLKSTLICSKHSVAGLGMISTIRDESNSLFTHSMGRGAIIYTFRQNILSNLGVQPPPLMLRRKKDDISSVQRNPTKVQVTIAGMTQLEYNILEQELRQNKKALPMDIEIRRIDDKLSFNDSISFTAISAIHITNRYAQHMLATATCLPRGATLIVLDAMLTPDVNVMINRVERDYLEMAGYFSLHWLALPSSGQMDEIVKANLNTIVRNTFQFIEHET